MEFSSIGRAVLRAREGERLTAYRDTQGILTISVGVTSASGFIKVVPGMTITAKESDDLFLLAVEAYVDTVRTSLKRAVPQEFFDACVSLCYNIGQPAFAKSTLVKKVNAGDIAAVEQFLAWGKPKEIMDRRYGEYDQARTPYSVQMPKARRSDARRISVPNAPAPVVVAMPAPSAVVPAATPATDKVSALTSFVDAILRLFKR